MKKVITKDELKEVMVDAVNSLCDTVSSTIGPTGNNILINNSDQTPFITNDGVTIASNIESDDKRINTVLEIVKEASLKTNELVGDGTTTTLVLLQSIFNLGLEEINKGKNKILLKNELLNYSDIITKKILKNKQEVSYDNLLNIALTSSNDLEIAKLSTEVFDKVNSKYSIKLEESLNDLTYYEIKRGYTIPINNISNMYFSKNKNINLNDVYILLLRGYLSNLEDISEVINECFNNNKNIIIFVEGMDESIKNELLVYYLSEHKNIFITEIEEYSTHKESIYKDIMTLTNSTIKNIDYESVVLSDLGFINNINISKEEVNLSVENTKTKLLINELNEELNNIKSDYEKEFIRTRLSKLENGIAYIYVGGITKSEKREKLMRYEDTICALQVAKEGVTIGEGITYLKVANELDDNDAACSIVKKSLEKPFEKILENLGKDSNFYKEEIIKSNFKKIYDYKTDNLISINKSNIIDPINIVTTSFKNALSIAAILLSTSSLVINERIEETSKIDLIS